MKAKDIFPSNYMKKEDLDRPVIASIARVCQEEVKSDKGRDELKPVMYFDGKHLKPIIVNRGNWEACALAYGEESDNWTGRSVEIYVDPTVMFGGRRVGGIRLRIPSNGNQQRPQQNGNGHQQAQAPQNQGQKDLTWPEAKALIEKHGHNHLDFKSYLQQTYNRANWLPSRETPIVLNWISLMDDDVGKKGTGEFPMGEEEIPF